LWLHPRDIVDLRIAEGAVRFVMATVLGLALFIGLIAKLSQYRLGINLRNPVLARKKSMIGIYKIAAENPAFDLTSGFFLPYRLCMKLHIHRHHHHHAFSVSVELCTS
jgi:hypothetical protein